MAVLALKEIGVLSFERQTWGFESLCLSFFPLKLILKPGFLTYGVMAPTYWDKHSILVLQELPKGQQLFPALGFEVKRIWQMVHVPGGWEGNKSVLAQRWRWWKTRRYRLALGFPKSLFWYRWKFFKKLFKLQILLLVMWSFLSLNRQLNNPLSRGWSPNLIIISHTPILASLFKGFVLYFQYWHWVGKDASPMSSSNTAW
jgi:hypothetical protein